MNRCKTSPFKVISDEESRRTPRASARGGCQGEAPFGYDEAAPMSEAGLLLPNVRTLARVHGWEVHLDSSYTAGVRYGAPGVTVEHTEATATA